MSNRPIPSGPGLPAPGDVRLQGPSQEGQGAVGPGHFWERALSRRRFLRTAAGSGAALASGLWLPSTAQAAGDDPRPIPGGFVLLGVFIHHFPPVSGNEPSNIGDFIGVVGNSRIFGAGTETNKKAGKKTRLLFQADIGFNQGTYVGLDGRQYQGTFAFV